MAIVLFHASIDLGELMIEMPTRMPTFRVTDPTRWAGAHRFAC